jgi:hypothetical protein
MPRSRRAPAGNASRLNPPMSPVVARIRPAVSSNSAMRRMPIARIPLATSDATRATRKTRLPEEMSIPGS